MDRRCVANTNGLFLPLTIFLKSSIAYFLHAFSLIIYSVPILTLCNPPTVHIIRQRLPQIARLMTYTSLMAMENILFLSLSTLVLPLKLSIIVLFFISLILVSASETQLCLGWLLTFQVALRLFVLAAFLPLKTVHSLFHKVLYLDLFFFLYVSLLLVTLLSSSTPIIRSHTFLLLLSMHAASARH
jgi:hypothetical protein